MRIRSARESKASILSALALSAKRHWGYSPEDMARWQPQFVISTNYMVANPTYVAELENEVVGFYSLVPTARDWELDHLWVSPRLIRRGIGRALLAHAAAKARAAGASSMAIDADPNAEPFYIACGAARQGIVVAPVINDPARIRPQLLLEVISCAA